MEEAAGCELSDSVCDVNQVLDCINSLMAEHSDNSDDDSFSSDDQGSNESVEEECGDSFNRVQIANVIQQALNFSCLSNHLKEIKGAKTSLSRNASPLLILKIFFAFSPPLKGIVLSQVKKIWMSFLLQTICSV